MNAPELTEKSIMCWDEDDVAKWLAGTLASYGEPRWAGTNMWKTAHASR